jgi:hypothetical protein
MKLMLENKGELNDLALDLAEKILQSKIGAERCSCCRQKIPQTSVGDVVDQWAAEWGDNKDISYVHGAIVNTITFWLRDRGIIR